ncbi:TetR/AcrR family transcriptional regulator [Microbacterium ulmi]
MAPRVDRRAQIIAATIEVIAREGVAGATFARIREHARLSSTRLISYHFDSKEALLQAVLQHVIGQAGEVMSPVIAAARSPREKLAAYIRSNLAFLAERPDYARTAVAVLAAGTAAADSTTDQAEDLLVSLFLDAQRDGVMRSFDAPTFAATVRAAIDSTVTRFAHSPQLDLVACGEQLVDLFDRAVRPD